jgi:hypothetical protein
MPLVLDCDIQRRMDPLVLSAIVEHAAIRHSTMPQDDPKAAIWIVLPTAGKRPRGLPAGETGAVFVSSPNGPAATA